MKPLREPKIEYWWTFSLSFWPLIFQKWVLKTLIWPEIWVLAFWDHTLWYHNACSHYTNYLRIYVSHKFVTVIRVLTRNPTAWRGDMDVRERCQCVQAGWCRLPSIAPQTHLSRAIPQGRAVEDWWLAHGTGEVTFLIGLHPGRTRKPSSFHL